ncbi:hypothetical protein [Pseudanabaena sp. PCC 6802]|uniref:hypothetical protein n=1 Tax=Pseudanabaena sp. PCC 6802 TaxID=118173 RepID=UPI00034756F8|nr:hypothetical protein [Pseudanabaena sp. PCC 6802]
MFSGDRIRIAYKPELPLAMYRELATHLSQVDGVTIDLIWQDRQDFSYDASQIAGMYISAASLSERSQALVRSILDRYGSWQIQTDSAATT